MVATANATATSFFQGGDHVELLSAQGKAPASTWKIQGKIIKSFEKAIKGNAFQMDGRSETKMQLPKTMASASSSLGLTHRFLVFQLLVPHTRSLSIEVGFSDFQKIRRRLVFSSAFRETATTTLHVQIPIGANVPRDQWMNLVFDLQALTERFFPTSSYRSTESICISGSCRLKRIFTMKDAPFCSSIHDNLEEQLLQYKNQRLHNRDPTSVPTAVATFSDMKEIPKQFIFSAAPSCLPIPTEYFLVSSERAEPTFVSSVISSGVANASTKAADIGRISKAARGAPATATTKTKSVKVGGNRVRAGAEAGVHVTTEQSADVTRVRSAPSGRVMTRQQQEAAVFSEPVQATDRKLDNLRVSDTGPYSIGSRSRSELGASSPEPNRPVSSTRSNLERSVTLFPGAKDEEQETASVALNEGISKGKVIETKASWDPSAQSSGNYDEHDANAAKRRKQRRQDVIAEIQSKLDQLTKEAEEEEERDREAFLNYTSIPSEPHTLESVSYGSKGHRSHDQTQCSQEKTVSALVESAIDYWHDEELLRSPEPMVLRRVHAAKKPDIAFSSSIFNFSRAENPRDVEHTTEKVALPGKRLFDWDSLLEDSVGSLSTSQKHSAGSSKLLDREHRPPLAETRELRDVGSTTKVKSDEVSRRGRDNKRTDIKRSDDELKNLLDLKRRDGLQPATSNVGYDHESALDSQSTWESCNVEHTCVRAAQQVETNRDGDVLQSSFDFSTSPTKPEHDCQTGTVLKNSTSQDSSPRRTSETSLDITDAIQELERVGDVPHSVGGEKFEQDQIQAPQSEDDHHSNDCDDDDSFDFDELVVCDRDTRSQSDQRGQTQQRHNEQHGKPAKRLPTDADSITTSHIGPQNVLNLREKGRTVGMPRTQPDSTAGLGPAPTSASPPRKPLAMQRDEACEPPQRPSSSRLVSSSSRRLASLLESTDWSQLPLSSTVLSQGAPRNKAPELTADRIQDKSHASTRNSKPNGTTSSSLELIYDPILRCYYDPVGKKYYTLAK